MAVYLDSSAPRISPVATWSLAGATGRLLLHKSVTDEVEVGIRRLEHGAIAYNLEVDELSHFFRGKAVFKNLSGEALEVLPGTIVHFKKGWRGEAHVSEPIEVAYMQCPGQTSERTPVLRQPKTAAPLKDWGNIPTMIEGSSTTAGILLSRDPDGRAESGIWTCTPGIWKCDVTSDEFCHFLDGSCTYIHESGERIEIAPDTLAFFPQGWSGRCEVRQTLRKVYMIR